MAFGERKVPPAKQEEPAKTIEINAEMQGTLAFREPVDLKINGHFSGALDVRGTLTVGLKALVEADINGDNVVVAGRVTGNVSVTKLLTLLPTAVLHGNIAAPKLNIVEGALFQGQCQMTLAETGTSMDIKELAAFLEIDEPAILELVRSGKIPVLQEGDQTRFERTAIERWASSGMVS